MAAKRRFLKHEPTAEGPLSNTVVILWHGAGGDVDQAHLIAVAKAAAADGAFVARARFGYRMAGKRGPDRMPKLTVHAAETVRLVIEASGLKAPRIVLGGRSMGGRVTTMMMAEGFEADGLILLSYPLHPAGKQEKLRDAHLPDVVAPMLFVAGSRDALSNVDLLSPVIARLGRRATLEMFEGADHSFRRVEPTAVVEVCRQWWNKLPA